MHFSLPWQPNEIDEEKAHFWEERKKVSVFLARLGAKAWCRGGRRGAQPPSPLTVCTNGYRGAVKAFQAHKMLFWRKVGGCFQGGLVRWALEKVFNTLPIGLICQRRCLECWTMMLGKFNNDAFTTRVQGIIFETFRGPGHGVQMPNLQWKFVYWNKEVVLETRILKNRSSFFWDVVPNKLSDTFEKQ